MKGQKITLIPSPSSNVLKANQTKFHKPKLMLSNALQYFMQEAHNNKLVLALIPKEQHE